MRKLRGAVFGCGFWSPFQLAAWQEVGGVEFVAAYNRTRRKAEAIAARFAIPRVYDDAEALLAREELDVVDVITDVDTHAPFVELAARYKVPVICQKPMAPTLESARRMVAACADAGVPFFVHENWRWQRPLRAVKAALETSGLGRPFRGRITFANSFPVFDNQPFLRELPRFILTDIGSHILDAARFLFGDAQRLYCQTRRVNPAIAGEDVATVMLQMGEVTVTCEMSYASAVEHDRFPETYVCIECEQGAVELGPDYWVRVTRAGQGTHAMRCAPPRYGWADPAYDLVHASIAACNANLLQGLRTGAGAETTGADNLKTMELVFGAYTSAEHGQAITL